MNTKVLLVRHGETEWSKDDRFTGVSDIPLTDIGREHAQALARRLSRFSSQITAVFSSPMKRSIETAQIIANQIDLSVQIVSELRELNYGAWEGLRREEILTQFFEEYTIWASDPAIHSPPQGETGQALIKRVLPSIERLITNYAGETIVIVAHKTVNRLLICSLLGISLKSYRYAIVQDTACLNVLGFTPDNFVSLIKLNDTSHYDSRPFTEKKG